MNIDVSARLGRRQDRTIHQGEFEQMSIARRIANGDQAQSSKAIKKKLLPPTARTSAMTLMGASRA
jgi:hypothetical protein